MKYLIILILGLLGCTTNFIKTEEDAFFDKGVDLYNAGMAEDAVAHFKAMIVDYKWSSKLDDCYYFLGLSYISMSLNNEVLSFPQYLKEARSWFSLVPSWSNKANDAVFEIGYSYYLEGNYDSSRVVHYNLVTSYPSSDKADNAALYVGHYYRKVGHRDSSIVWYEKVISHYPGSGAYDNGLYWAGDYYYDHRQQFVEYEDKAINYLRMYCDLRDTLDDKYAKAITKLASLGVKYE